MLPGDADGTPFTGWFTEDFTLAELKTLRAVERLPALRQESTTFDGRYDVPTFTEVLELRERLSDELGRGIGVYPETKHPTYFDAIGLSMEEPLVAALRRHGLDKPSAEVVVQSFETGNLRDLDTMTPVATIVRSAPRRRTSATPIGVRTSAPVRTSPLVL